MNTLGVKDYIRQWFEEPGPDFGNVLWTSIVFELWTYTFLIGPQQ